MAILSTNTRRWAVPGVVAAVIAAGVGGTVLSADAAPSLPPRSAEDLLTDLAQADSVELSGTVVQKANLGLPELPDGGGRGSAELRSLLSGTHTLRVWYGGPEEVRVALLGTLGESDVIRNGRDLWTWSSETNSARHITLPDVNQVPAPDAMPPMTPQDAAQRALDMIDANTDVTVDGTASVADRSAYELVLTPKDDRSLIESVRLAVDSETSVPLRVRVYAEGTSEPAFEVGFTNVDFGGQDDQHFEFRPPPGADVTESEHDGNKAPESDAGEPTLVGSGWTRVLVVDGLDMSAGTASDEDPNDGSDGDLLRSLLSQAERVDGSWGSGYLLTSSLINAVLTDEGRLVIGSVEPDVLYEAAAR